MDFPIDGHFYTRRLTEEICVEILLLFVFGAAAKGGEEEEESEWVWNEAIAKPLRDVLDDDASRYVPVMIQGLAECREILVDATDPKKGSWHFVFGKRSLTLGRGFYERNNEDGIQGTKLRWNKWSGVQVMVIVVVGIVGKNHWTLTWARGSVPPDGNRRSNKRRRRTNRGD